MRAFFWLLCFASVAFATSASCAAEPAFPVTAKKILFLGDSITFGGHYPVLIEAQLRLDKLAPGPEIISLGLPSENVTGLSEPTHPFPRPNANERLERTLEKIRPDVVVACYGMNDGIYAPFSEERFQAYQAGINHLIEKVHASGARLVLMAPPPFDPLPMKKAGKLRTLADGKFDWNAVYENYDDEVMARYARWILAQKDRVEMVVDLRTPILNYVETQRVKNPGFAMSGDGVHLNEDGHRVIAQAILQAWNVPMERKPDPELIKLINQKQGILKHAWLSEIGHLRPGITPGLPIERATEEAKELDAQIQKQLEKSSQ